MMKSDMYAARLAALRAEMGEEKIDGYLVPRANQHLGEFIAPCDERLAWLTGFTGSAGAAVVLSDRAAIFTDGRYQIQLKQECSAELFEHHHSLRAPISDWLSAHLPRGARLGFDPWHHSIAAIERLTAQLEAQGGAAIAIAPNLIDRIWTDRPPAPSEKVMAHDLRYAGKSAADKIAAIARHIKGAAILTDPTSIAWLLNIRGRDVPHTPIALCFAIIHPTERVDLFIDAARIDDSVRNHLGDRVDIRAPAELSAALAALPSAQIDRHTAPQWIFAQLGRAEIHFAADPCLMPKAVKNKTELNGMRAAHIRDGAALSHFLFWLDNETNPPDEIGAVEKLAELRRRQNMFCDLSFSTIAGSGANGAIVHYRVNDESNRRLCRGDLFLVDSGGQYLDGTTDVTRTIAIGAASETARRHFTLVLKGHIALARAIFPRGTTGHQLDAIARQPLWAHGLDFDHGTGHGVGAFLSVHEGPQMISPRGSDVALEEGMILSNEPGYYRPNAYGIRIENLVAVVRKAERDCAGEGRDMLGFETLTCAPIDLDLVEGDMLNSEERDWLNRYHQWVRAEIAPQLDEAAQDWLKQATRAI